MGLLELRELREISLILDILAGLYALLQFLEEVRLEEVLSVPEYRILSLCLLVELVLGLLLP